jgi:hypothetical protein
MERFLAVKRPKDWRDFVATIAYELLGLAATLWLVVRPDSWVPLVVVVGTQALGLVVFHNRFSSAIFYHWRPWALIGILPIWGIQIYVVAAHSLGKAILVVACFAALRAMLRRP